MVSRDGNGDGRGVRGLSQAPRLRKISVNVRPPRYGGKGRVPGHGLVHGGSSGDIEEVRRAMEVERLSSGRHPHFRNAE